MANVPIMINTSWHSVRCWLVTENIATVEESRGKVTMLMRNVGMILLFNLSEADP